MAVRTCVALCEETLAADPRADSAIHDWSSDLVAEGWTVALGSVPASASVADVRARAGVCDHLQLFGHLAVPLVRSAVDGHGMRFGDCDAPYATASPAGWDTTQGLWPSPPVRTVSRIDLSGLGDEAALFAKVMARNHAYRTGAFQYDGLACLVNRLEYLWPGMTAAAIRDLETIVGAGNVVDITGKYPDEQFFQSQAGRSFLLGGLYSGGDSFQVHEYYIGTAGDFAAGLVPIGVLSIFCSYGWMFDTWPLQRAALAGGSLAVLYNPRAQTSLSAWGGDRTLGEVVRAYHRGDNLWTIQGDATLRRREQDMGVSQATFDKLEARVAAIEAGKMTIQPVVPAPLPPGTMDVAASGWGPSLVWTGTQPVSVANVPGALPAAQYQQIRYSPGGVTAPPFTGLVPGSVHTVRVHLCEMGQTQPGQRILDIWCNGAPVLLGVDVIAEAGRYRACMKEFQATADVFGRIVVGSAASAASADKNAYLCAVQLV